MPKIQIHIYAVFLPGFVDLDRKTSGWQKSDLIILAARPSMGKTALALSMARNVAVDFNKPIVILFIGNVGRTIGYQAYFK